MGNKSSKKRFGSSSDENEIIILNTESHLYKGELISPILLICPHYLGGEKTLNVQIQIYDFFLEIQEYDNPSNIYKRILFTNIISWNSNGYSNKSFFGLKIIDIEHIDCSNEYCNDYGDCCCNEYDILVKLLSRTRGKVFATDLLTHIYKFMCDEGRLTVEEMEEKIKGISY